MISVATTPIHLATVVDNQFGENAYIVWRQEGGPCWIIDPGFPPAPQKIIAHIEKHRLSPAALILTHGHLDHIAGVPEIMKAFPALPIHIAAEAKRALTDPNENLSGTYGMALSVGEFETIDLPAESDLELGGTRWRVLDTSGHAPGSRSLYCAQAGVVIVGDALFQGSIGRMDFHHSDETELLRNIREKLFTLPDETVVHSGHGPATTIGREKRFNPFVQEGGLQGFE
ncbi:MAG TPA: MBL fold metallo-hydrolase [Phycisphaerae bacterium]|nr:MBL fold metallo-hydrolase [Phycisphaerae bacterium]